MITYHIEIGYDRNEGQYLKSYPSDKESNYIDLANRYGKGFPHGETIRVYKVAPKKSTYDSRPMEFIALIRKTNVIDKDYAPWIISFAGSMAIRYPGNYMWNKAVKRLVRLN